VAEDAQLIALLIQGDAGAIALVRGWAAAAIGRFRGRLGGDAEDVEQEVLLDLLEALDAGRFRRESRLETYVHSYARFKCIDRLRALGRRDVVDLVEEELVLDAPSALDEITREEGAALARRVMAALPAQCQELWSMIADGMSYREMSAATGISEGAIRVRVHRCRKLALELRDRVAGGTL
jgi:RNA polymerase sigma-70 factor (ECF subfamily)